MKRILCLAVVLLFGCAGLQSTNHPKNLTENCENDLDSAEKLLGVIEYACEHPFIRDISAETQKICQSIVEESAKGKSTIHWVQNNCELIRVAEYEVRLFMGDK